MFINILKSLKISKTKIVKFDISFHLSKNLQNILVIYVFLNHKIKQKVFGAGKLVILFLKTTP